MWRVGGGSQALVDRQFKNDLNQAFKAVACALHSYDLEKVVLLVLVSLPHILSRSVASLLLLVLSFPASWRASPAADIRFL